VARKKGALGGKLMGAGGGGFFMFYCQNGEKYMVTQAMRKLGLRREMFKIDWDGAMVMLNSKESSHSHDTRGYTSNFNLRAVT
jgi:D-glycero-alpha-D-manno-heptose-7-phosphate kinase